MVPPPLTNISSMITCVNKAANSRVAMSESGHTAAIRKAGVAAVYYAKFKKRIKKADQLATSSVILDVGYMYASPLIYEETIVKAKVPQKVKKCPTLLDFISE